MEDIFKDVVNTFLFPSNTQKPTGALQLAVDEYEEDDYYLWCADLPGVKRDQLKVREKRLSRSQAARYRCSNRIDCSKVYSRKASSQLS